MGRIIIVVLLLAVALGTLPWSARTVEAESGVGIELIQGMNLKGENAMAANAEPKEVYVRVIGADGNLTEPIRTKQVVRTDAEWKALLSDEQYRILRNHGTEPAFCGGLLKNKEAGVYTCAGCELPLFSNQAKFDSGTGWPSFFSPIAAENILEKADNSYGMTRVEILCTRCESHLGHVFPDGPKPSGMRYCLNSEALNFHSNEELKKIAEAVEKTPVAELVLAGGCFWCVEAVFEEIDGVIDAVSGYAGGKAETANYEAVCTGKTNHAEVVKIIYDPAKVTPEALLRLHFATHDPTTLNRQGADVGTQYRSAIFYKNEEEKAAAEKFIAEVTASKLFPSPIVTTLEPLTAFYPAEQYHQNYVCRNPNQPYVRSAALPKLEKVRAYLGSKKEAK